MPMYFDTIPAGSLETNCYLIGDEAAGVCAVVDPGAEPEKIRAMIAKSGLRLEKILLTHGHYDHVGAAAALATDGATIYLHPADANKDDARLFPPLETDFNLCREGDTLPVGGIGVRVLHTPGHSAGCVTFLAGDVMLCGDTLFAGSMGRSDFPGGNTQQLFDSLKKLALLEGDYQVLPGHDRTTTLGRERVSNVFVLEALK